MDYKEKVIALLNSQELSKEQKEKLENIFPELKESEDERMSKEIIDFLRLPHYQFAGKRDHEKWIAWLEKQGHPKMLNADEVVGWLDKNIDNISLYSDLIVKFVADFKL